LESRSVEAPAIGLVETVVATAKEYITRCPGMVALQQIENKLFLQPLADLVAKLSYFRRLERTWKLIEKDYADSGLRLEKAARVSGISKNHLNVIMRRATGFTFYQLLIRYRLLRAITMMRSRSYSLLEIVLETGFGSLNTFEKNFRSVIGLTPKEFRNLRDF
jgi:AraC-like DNA-binding protein